MASMTQDFGRLAGGIASSRTDRIEAAPKRRKAAADRHTAVGASLKDLKTSRVRAGHAHRTAATAARKGRHAEVRALLTRFRRHRETWRRHYLTEAATFMRDLTAGVAELRDAFGASQRNRATARREAVRALWKRLGEYGRDRREASAAWRGSRPRHAAHERSA